MPPEPDKVRLLHMRDAAREARGFIVGRSRADLDRDSMLLRALVNCLEVIGETACQVTEETRKRITEIPKRAVIGTRNRLIHAYWEAFLRVVYANEILGRTEIGADGLLLNVVTGGGKTAIIAALMPWLRIAHGLQKFILLCPNLIVRDRLEDDFAGGKVFKDRDLLPESAVSSGPGHFDITTLGSGPGGGCVPGFARFQERSPPARS